MTKMKDDQPTRIAKNRARKTVVNISDSDLESDPEGFEDDIFCPTWLKPKIISQAPSSNTSDTSFLNFKEQYDISNPIKANKRNLELSSLSYFQVPMASQKKKIDSPIHKSFFSQPEQLNQFQKVLIEIIETEIDYFKSLNLCQTVYSSLLLNVAEYQNILTSQEKMLIFQDITLLTKISKTFIKSTIESLKLCNGFINTQSLQKFELDGDNQNLFNYNIRQLVINSSVHKFDIGLSIHQLFKATSFKATILAYFAKHNFRMKILNAKLTYGGPAVSKWLKEADFLTKSKTKNWSLQTILIQPMQRTMKYPLLLKQLIDSSNGISSDVQKHELNLALIKINLIIDECNTQESLGSYEEIDKKIKQTMLDKKRRETIYDANFEKCIPLENELRLDVAAQESIPSKGKGRTPSKGKGWLPIRNILFAPKEKFPAKPGGQYIYLVTSFRDKYNRIKGLQATFEMFSGQLIEFMQQQSKYASLWKQFLQETDAPHEGPAHYIDSIYSSYVDKMETQLLKTHLLVEELNSKLISAITLVITYCDEVKIQIQMHRKLRSSYVTYIKECEQNKHKPNIFQKTHTKAQTCINIENQLKDKLPQLLLYLSTIVNLLQGHSNRLYLNWLREQIGERSLLEFDQLRNPQMSKEDAKSTHADIIHFYHNNMQLTKLALEEGHQGLDYFRHFTAT